MRQEPARDYGPALRPRQLTARCGNSHSRALGSCMPVSWPWTAASQLANHNVLTLTVLGGIAHISDSSHISYDGCLTSVARVKS